MPIDGQAFMRWLHEQRKRDKALFLQRPQTYLTELEATVADLLTKYHLTLPPEQLRRQKPMNT
jgi:hypothetical protein